MHPTPIFTNNDKGQALAFTADFPFAIIAVNGEKGPVTALVPLVYSDERKQFLGHVAKANPFWEAAQKSPKAIAVFRGHHAYVSPSSYPSKMDNPNVVPTWNYMAVEIRGDITVEVNPKKMMDYLKPLTEVMEIQRAAPWKISDAPEDYITKLSNAIVGLSLSLEGLHFVEKLSQNKIDTDREGVIVDLASSSNSAGNAVADVMKKNLSDAIEER